MRNPSVFFFDYSACLSEWKVYFNDFLAVKNTGYAEAA